MSRRDEAVVWRASVLEAMLNALTVAGPIIVVVAFRLREPPFFDLGFAAVLTAVSAIVALRFARRLGFRVRAGLSTALLVVACLTFIALTGFSLGAAAGLVFGIVMSVMLLGRRVALAALVFTAVTLIAVGLAIHAGWSHPRQSDSDPRLLVNWVRMAVSFSLLTGALAIAVDFVVRHVETKYAELSAAYDELGALHRKLETSKEEDRRFIARELHDDLGQALTLLKLGLKSGKATPFTDPVRVVDGLIVKVRDLSRSLRPALLDEVGLAPALSAFLEEQATASGVSMKLGSGGFDGRFAGDLEIACFRLVQEAVTNTLRHAEARNVKVRLERGPESLRLRIEDDGRGGAGPEVLADAAVRGHMGVAGMRERVRVLGGTFRIQSEPGQGTRIDVELPFAPRTSQHPSA